MRLFVFVIIFMIVTTACAESTINKVDKTSNSGVVPQSPEKIETAAPTKSPQIFKIGDTLRVNDLEITLNGVRTNNGTKYNKPKNAKYLLVDLTIENKGDKSSNVSSLLNMSLYDAESFKNDVTIFAEKKGSLDAEISTGRKIRGEVAFDVSESSYYDFIFGEPFRNGQAIWRINGKDGSTANVATSNQADPTNNVKKNIVEETKTQNLVDDKSKEKPLSLEEMKKYVVELKTEVLKENQNIVDFGFVDDLYVEVDDPIDKQNWVIPLIVTNHNESTKEINVKMFYLVNKDGTTYSPNPSAIKYTITGKDFSTDSIDKGKGIALTMPFIKPQGVNLSDVMLRVYNGKNHIDLKLVKP